MNKLKYFKYNENTTLYKRKKELEKELNKFKRCPIALLDSKLLLKHSEILIELNEIEKFYNKIK